MIFLNDQNFEKTIENNLNFFLVDFYADWCPPCQLLSPILEKLEQEFHNKIIFGKLNVDESPLTSQKYNVSLLPTVILFKNNQPIANFVGLKKEQDIKNWLESFLVKDGGN